MGLDTVNIDALATQFGRDVLDTETDAAMASLITAVPWLAAGGHITVPVIRKIIRDVFEYFDKQIGWIAYRFNTQIWVTDQGKDYIQAVEELNALPDDVSDEVWDAAEEKKNHAARNLINFNR